MTALFESMRVRRGAIPFLERHVARMGRAAASIGLAAPPSDMARQVTARLGSVQEGALRADWNGQGLTVVERDLPRTSSVTLAVVREAHPGYPWKSVERKPFDRALGVATLAGAGEALLLDQAGYVAEAARFSLGWLDEDAMVFPPLAMKVLASLGRERAIELAPALNLAVREARVAPAALRGRPLFLANAVRGIVPVTALDGVSAPADARIAALADRFWP